MCYSSCEALSQQQQRDELKRLLRNKRREHTATLKMSPAHDAPLNPRQPRAAESQEVHAAAAAAVTGVTHDVMMYGVTRR